MTDNNIQTSVYYTPAHHHTFLRKIRFNEAELKNTDLSLKNSISLPNHNHKIKEVDKLRLQLKIF